MGLVSISKCGPSKYTLILRISTDECLNEPIHWQNYEPHLNLETIYPVVRNLIFIHLSLVGRPYEITNRNKYFRDLIYLKCIYRVSNFTSVNAKQLILNEVRVRFIRNGFCPNPSLWAIMFSFPKKWLQSYLYELHTSNTTILHQLFILQWKILQIYSYFSMKNL